MSIALLARRSTIPTKNLLVRHDFLEGTGQILLDRTGNGYNGILGATTGVDITDPTWNSSGLSFDGANSYVLLPNAPLGGEYTLISVGTPTDFATIRPAIGTANGSTYLGTATAGKVIGTLLDSVNQKSLQGPLITAGQPVFMASRASQANQTFEIFSNRTKAGFATTVGTHSAAGNQLNTVGRNTSTGSVKWLGSIHYVLAYTRLLTDSEMQQAYTALKKLLLTRGVALP